MEFDFEQAYQEIKSLLKKDQDINSAMQQMLDYCNEQYPHQIWNSLRTLNFEDNYTQISFWLDQVLKEQPIPARINGLWFGLCNPHHEGRPTCILYLAGSAEFSEKDSHANWVREAEYFPLKKEVLWIAPSSIFQEIHHKAFAKMYHTNEVPEYAHLCDYTLCLSYAALVVKKLCKDFTPDQWLGKATTRNIATGFDDGDYINMAKVDQNGIQLYE